MSIFICGFWLATTYNNAFFSIVMVSWPASDCANSKMTLTNLLTMSGDKPSLVKLSDRADRP